MESATTLVVRDRVLRIALLAMIAICAEPMTTLAQQPQSQPAQNAQQIQTLAVVNGKPVTRQQVANECVRRFGKDVLKSIINKQLVLAECHKRGIIITEKEVNDEIVKRAEKFQMSGERYIKLITSRKNISEVRLKNDVIWSEIALRRLAATELNVDQQEINERMEFEFGPKVQVREIAVKTRQEADQILAEARKPGGDFGRLAKDYSINPNSAAVRGLLPPIRRHSGMPQFENVAFALKPGEVSEIFQIEDRFIILQCERIFPATQLPAEQMTEAHQRIVDELRNAKLAKAAIQLFERLRQTSQIKNVINDPQLSQEMPGIVAIVNSQQITRRYLAEECIARFGHDMLDTEINRAILIQALQSKNMQVQQEDVNAEIERAARAYGYVQKDGAVDMDRWLKFVTQNNEDKIDFYIEDEVWPSVALKKLVEDRVTVTQEDLQKGFEANFGPRIEVLAIVFAEDRQALKVWKMASADLSKEYFGKLANQYSVEPASKNNFGQVPPIQMHGGRPELEKEAFRLKPGELSKVVQVGEHWVIMYCLGRTTPRVTDFDAVKDELHRNIFEKKLAIEMADEFERLRKGSQVDNFLAGTSQAGAPRTAKGTPANARPASNNPGAPAQPRR